MLGKFNGLFKNELSPFFAFALEVKTCIVLFFHCSWKEGPRLTKKLQTALAYHRCPTRTRAFPEPIVKSNTMDIYVGNLPWSASEQEIADAFAEHGTVEKATIIIDRDSGRSKGFGFVTMNDNDEANTAIEALNGYELDGRALKINEARPREERPPRRDKW